MQATAIIGSGYGDEGKGLFTDYFSSPFPSSSVIRFNGGAQAGHTVQTKEGFRHVFGHFASNSFLPNSKTILSRFFVINPIVFFSELKQLNHLNINPAVFSHLGSYISTPYDMLINQWLENKRNNNRHGSCGLGFGQTIQRNEIENVRFNFKDLISNKIPIDDIIEHFKLTIKRLELTSYLHKNTFTLQKEFIQQFINNCHSLAKLIHPIEHEILSFSKQDNFIFEGAQGLMLDQHYGDFPHVTRSNTGSKNISDIIKNTFIESLNTVYATRIYTTRHGAGKLKNELTHKPYENILDPTNIPNEHQGTLRFAFLDLDQLDNAITWDKNFNLNSISNSISVGISCLDQSDLITITKSNELFNIRNTALKDEIFKKTGINQFYESFSPTRNKIISSKF